MVIEANMHLITSMVDQNNYQKLNQQIKNLIYITDQQIRSDISVWSRYYSNINQLSKSWIQFTCNDDWFLSKGRRQKKNGKISDIEQKGGRGVESISLFLTD